MVEYCSFCHSALEGGEAFCSECGKAISAPGSVAEGAVSCAEREISSNSARGEDNRQWACSAAPACPVLAQYCRELEELAAVRATAAKERVDTAERLRLESRALARAAEARAKELEARAVKAEARLQEAEERASMAEMRAAAAELSLRSLRKKTRNTATRKRSRSGSAERADRVVERADQGAEHADRVVERADQGAERADRVVERADQGAERADRVVERADRGVEYAGRGADASTVPAELGGRAVLPSEVTPATVPAEPTSSRSQVYALNLGDTVPFGRYPQSALLDGHTVGPRLPGLRFGTREAIEWEVLDISNGVALLLACQGLDCQAYNAVNERVVWATCGLRRWLNGVFIGRAFNKNERECLLLDEVVNLSEGRPGGLGGNTRDRVFLLSYEEVQRYLPSASRRQLIPSAYALSRGVTLDVGAECCRWWLRSPGTTLDTAAIVGYDATPAQISVAAPGCAVRPAIRLRL